MPVTNLMSFLVAATVQEADVLQECAVEPHTHPTTQEGDPRSAYLEATVLLSATCFQTKLKLPASRRLLPSLERESVNHASQPTSN